MVPRLVRLAFLGFSLLAITIAPATAFADNETVSHWFFAPFGGITVFGDNFPQGALHDGSADVDNAFNVGARFGVVGASGLGLELAGGWTPTKVKNSVGDADLTLMHVSADLIYEPTIGRFGGPYFALGGGALRTSLNNVSPAGTFSFSPPSDKDDELNQGYADMAAGWAFPLGGHAAFRLEARNMLWLPYKHPEWANVSYQVYGAALELRLGGRAKDADADGVSDRRDKCPNTPAGCTVNGDGCPSDADGDGICDGLDKCPGTPKGAAVDATGCSKDSDADGVFDGLDKCPDTPHGAKVDASGCPTDSDGDGVYDGIDTCPNTQKGCVVDATGCPKDSDGDGVCDGLDKCASTASGAKVDQDGCPIEITEKETELLDTGMIRLNNVNFETGKAVLLPEDFPTLDIVGEVLRKWPQLKIEIGGHTDSRGGVAYNQKLSEARAQAVLTYLLQKFSDLKAEQMSAKGYGKSKPLVPNTNALNMAKNRRVEFVVLNKETLKKEVERRKTLQK
jgi:outer membrane protein OmpA-like peptidoglycan-associated protein